jgi:hypothetical protein
LCATGIKEFFGSFFFYYTPMLVGGELGAENGYLQRCFGAIFIILSF